MKEFKKIRKKSFDESNIIGQFKYSVKKYFFRAKFVRKVSFEEETNDEFMRFTATIDCDSFKERIVYYPDSLPFEHVIDVEFSLKHSDYIYTFYDIFNLFDIDDFNLYYYHYYSDMKFGEEIYNAIKSIFDATNRYYDYIERADTKKYRSALEKNYEADMTFVTGDESWRGEERDLFFLPLTHPVYSFADSEITPKIHKKLKKKNNKGELGIIYEKRLLKFLDSGKTFERKEFSRKKDFYKLYFRNAVQMFLITFIIVFIVIFVLALAVILIAFRGAEFYNDVVFGSIKVKPMFYNALLTAVVPSFFITWGIWFLKGECLISLIMPDNMKRRAENEFDDEMKRRYGNNHTIYRTIIAVILISFFAFDFVSSIDGIGYYDNYIRFSNPSACFKIVDVQYENLSIYKVRYDRNKPVENSYILADNIGNYYNYGEIDQNGKTQAKLNEIAEKYNKDIIEVESIDYIPQI